MATTSRLGDIQVGSYNCLPPDTKKVLPYRAPQSMMLNQLPYVWGNFLGFFGQEIGAAWDLDVTKDQAQKVTPLDEAYQEVEKATQGKWHKATEIDIKFIKVPVFQPGGSFTRSEVVAVHDDWSKKSIGTILGFDSKSFNAFSLDRTKISANVSNVAFFGRLEGIAPLVCCTELFEGPVKRTYRYGYSVAKTNATTSGHEYGLSIEASIGAKLDAVNAEASISGSMKWSSSTTESTTVQTSGGSDTEFPVERNQFGRLDLRICAGIYTGWLIYYRYERNSDKHGFGVYPMRVPIHVPDFSSAVATHVMTADATGYSATIRDLATQYTQAHARLDQEMEQLTIAGADQHVPAVPTAEIQELQLQMWAAMEQ